MALHKYQFEELFWECGSYYNFAMNCRDRSLPYRKEMIEAISTHKKILGLRAVINTWKRLTTPPTGNIARAKKPAYLKRYHEKTHA